MGKHVVYLRARDEAQLKASGIDPGDWVRNLVKKTLERGEQRIFPEPPARKARTTREK